MENLQQKVINWVKTLKGWQCELAYRLLIKEKLENSDIDEIVSMLKEEKQFEDKVFPNIGISINGESIVLLSIDSIENIEYLSPRNALKFAEKGLTVIYGKNGTGKSGYTRILKKVCGKPHTRDLIGNIYKPNVSIGKCTISYKRGEQVEQCFWSVNDGAIESLRSVDIFDSDTGTSYLNEANSVSYIPPIVAFFSSFSRYHDIIKEHLTTQKDQLIPKLPVPPHELSETNYVKNVYLSKKLDLSKFVWAGEDENRLSELDQKLKEADLKKAVVELREKKRKIGLLIKDIEDDLIKVSPQSKKEIDALASDLSTKEQAVLDAAKVLSNSSKLEGVGTESWKLLWSAAKEYSQKDAYLDDKKLYQHDRCVLCHQILDEETKTRLQNFDTFITNELSQIATDAKKRYNDRINSLPKDFTEDQIIDRCISAGLDRDWGKQIFNIWIQIYNNGEAIRLKRPLLNIYNDAQIALSALKEKSRRYEVTAAEYENDTKLFDRDAAAKQLLELKAQKWAFEQYEAIKIEQSRQMNVIRYDQWISQTNTRGITTKANEIGDLVITQSFVKRFNEELDKLGAGNIQVEFVKQINKGTTKHVIKIANATHNNPENILSEGEARIISLAAFLADVTGGNYANPFVFDDPISSLDQTYEEKTVKRLVELSKSQQVIVFTHRLSLLCQLNDACDNIKTLGIRRESWGTGEIGELPMSAKSPKNALKDILNNKLVRAKKVLNENGAEEYYLHAKMICSDFRILIERTVEYHLLGDVVQRYRRAVNTMGKVSSLAKINKHDCEMIDKFMTKYSFYEHSQPLEAPVELPLPDDISNDVNELLAWIEEFDKRKIID